MKNIIVKFGALFAIVVASLWHPSFANERTPPSALALASPTLEIGFPTRQSLIQFFYVPQQDEEPNVEVYLTYRSETDLQTVHLETMGPEGRAAGVESVFTLDADGDRERELFIIAAWPIRHSSVGTEGVYYRIYVYRKSFQDGKDLQVQRAHDIESKLGSGFDGTREGVKVSFPYKDYAAIRAALASVPDHIRGHR